MISVLSDVKLTMLAWVPLPPKGPHPPDEALIIMSDGKVFELCVGQKWTQAAWGPTRWAKLNNMEKLFSGALG